MKKCLGRKVSANQSLKRNSEHLMLKTDASRQQTVQQRIKNIVNKSSELIKRKSH